MPSWAVSGSYLEACNCDAICPCRRIGGVAGGRSTYGECTGALSWKIEQGTDGDVDLAGLAVVLALRYHDDEPGSPWSYVLYLDERASQEQLASLEAIFTGRRGGSATDHFPWAWKPSHLLGVVPAEIEVDHTPRRGWFRVGGAAGGRVVVRVAHAAEQPTTVSCVIPGHDHQGTEIVADVLLLDNEVGSLELHGRCGFETPFAYAGE